MALDFTTSLIKLNNQYTIVGTSEDITEDAVPKRGELYFLPIDGGQRVCKIGDGETPFGELPQIGVETATASTFGTAMASSTSPVMDGTASVGTETTKFARGDHKHPTDTSRAPTNHASSASTYGLGTTSNYGHVKISNGDVATVSSANGLVAGMNHSHSDLAPSGHTHDISIATSTATSELTLAHGSTYQLTAGGESFVFKMPTDNNTTYSVAKYNSLGLLKPAYTSTGAATLSTAAASNATTPTIASKTTTSGRYYGVEADKNGVLFVNVPWTDSNTDTKVAGTNTATSASEYPIFFKNSTGETTTAASARFNTGFTFSPGNGTAHTDLKITSAGGSVQLDLHRAKGCGYVVNNGGGSIGICAGVETTDMDDSVVFTGTSVYPGTTNVQSLGTSTYKWSNVYATAFTGTTYNGYTLAAACAKAVTDSSSASAISTGTSLVTERDVYYGLPKINNSHSYTSSTSIYAPTAGGTSGYVLVGNGTTSAPTWKQKLPIANGGTNATTAAEARANLETATMSNSTSTTSPAFPSGSAYGTTFSRNSIVNTTAKNDNYMLHVSSTGDLYTGYQINSMTTPTWTKVSLDGHEHSASDLTSGTLGIARGGTGVTSVSALRDVLGLQRVTSLSQTKSTTAVGSTASVSFSAPGLIVGYSHGAALQTGYNGTTFATSISGNVLTQSMTIKFSTGSARSVTATLFYIPVG